MTIDNPGEKAVPPGAKCACINIRHTRQCNKPATRHVRGWGYCCTGCYRNHIPKRLMIAQKK